MLSSLRWQVTFIICSVIIAVGVAIGLTFVKVTQHQEQKNDQSQHTEVNAITKTVIINNSETGHKRKNIIWTNEWFMGKDSFLDRFYSLEEWQKKDAKVWSTSTVYSIIYMIDNIEVYTITNELKVSNYNKSYSTNINSSESIFIKAYKWFKKDKTNE